MSEVAVKRSVAEVWALLCIALAGEPDLWVKVVPDEDQNGRFDWIYLTGPAHLYELGQDLDYLADEFDLFVEGDYCGRSVFEIRFCLREHWC